MENSTTTTTTQRTGNVKFMSVSEFKEAVSGSSTTPLQVLRNEKTGKKFMSINGKSFRVQQDIDSSKNISVLIPDGSLSDACLVNATGGATNVFTL